MKIGAVRAVLVMLLLAVGLSLSSCVVYEEPYRGGGHWHDHDWHDHWR